MTPKERMQAYFCQEEDVKMCANCKYFHKHYVYESETARYREIVTGHCSVKNLRARKVYDICDHFTRREE